MKIERESELRLRAFHIFYRRTFKNEINPLHRFVKALLASARTIQNPELIEEFLNSRKDNDEEQVELSSSRQAIARRPDGHSDQEAGMEASQPVAEAAAV